MALKDSDRKVTYRKLSDLRPYARNARTYSQGQIDQLEASIREWGWTIPVLIDETNGVIAGHGRLMAAKRLGITEVPCIVASGWSDAQKRAYVIADNKLTENGGWDQDILKSELLALGEAGFDLNLAGFDPETKNGGEESNLDILDITSEVEDKFWISIRGPLCDQAETLSKLRDALGDLTNVDIELGTIEAQGPNLNVHF